MLIVRVELHSAITGKITEIARMRIAHIGGTEKRGDYDCRTYRGRTKQQLDRQNITRRGSVKAHRRWDEHVWNLVARALNNMEYR